MIFLAEIEPGFIFMIIIWLFSSFFSKKKKGVKNSPNKEKKASSFESIMKKLGELPNMDMSQAQDLFSESEEEYVEDEFVESEFTFEDIESEEVDCIQEQVNAESIVKKKKQSREVKLFGTPLQNAMVLKEILDKPRALRPFSFSGSNDT
jgi:uncharacterized membrane protein YhiD involved in acid resistance|tara:strand:+ start:3950 stop:4399 length:450 start_codon:yes stop_codon:yes gene_type:complete